MLRPKTLQQRMVLFLLLPVAALLAAMGWLGFTYAEDSLLRGWRETTVLELERAAHQVDMALNEPKLWMHIIRESAGTPSAEAVQEWILQHLNHMPGVERALIERFEDGPLAASHPPEHGRGAEGHARGVEGHGMAGHGKRTGTHQMPGRAEIAQVNPPRYDTGAGHQTVSLISDLLSASNDKIGHLEVVLRFDFLIENALSHGWKRGEVASLIDDEGNILSCSPGGEGRRFCSDEKLFNAVMKGMKGTRFGTIIDESGSEDEIIGFYRLSEAPWTLVLTARASDVLAPLKRFRNIFLLSGSLFTIFILVLIRAVAGRTVASIGEVSRAAQKVARGDYHVQLSPGSDDEVGQLVHSFNTMATQLEERMRLKEALDLAMEVQQTLLPVKSPDIKGLDIAGTCVYCDETGGDYYDFLQFPELGKGKIGLAVGDVAGHGISAALLMTTARAMVRTRILQPGSLSQVANDVNRLLCRDTERTANFMTLFLALMDAERGELRWVRAGHAPGILYDWGADSFEELKGEGFALGFDSAGRLEEYRYDGWSSTKLLFIGTDGIWEAEDPEGEQFGMERLRAVLRQHCRSSSQRIMEEVLRQVTEFRREKPQEDDITMIVLKSRG